MQQVNALIKEVQDGELLKRQLAIQQIVPLLEGLQQHFQQNPQDLATFQSSIQQMLESSSWQELSFAIKVSQLMLPHFDEGYRTQFFNKVDSLLSFPENRVQEQLVQALQHVQAAYPGEVKAVYALSLEKLDQTLQKTTAEEQNHYVALEKMVGMVFEKEYASKANRLKVMEAMFQCKYQFTNPQNVLVQGYLAVVEALYGWYGPNDALERVLRKASNHQNKYVRKFAVDLLSKADGAPEQAPLFLSILQHGLHDESIEVRKAVLLHFQLQLQKEKLPYAVSQFKECFCVGLLLNCHMENLMDISAEVSLKVFKDDAEDQQSQNPILGLITYVKKNQLAKCLATLYEGTVSRYYQIRACSGQTLQSLVLFMKNTNQLDTDQIAKILLNLAFYEPDPQARAAGLSCLYHFARLYDLSPQQMQSVGECASFHLSDIPYNCKDNCAKILTVLFQKTRDKALIEEKCALLKDRKLIFQDYLGPEVQDKEFQEQLQKQLNSQGGKERVITKHQLNIALGVALILKHFGATFGQELSDLKPYLVHLLQTCLDILRQNHLFSEGFQEYKQITYVTINEAAAYFKQVKRLSIKVLEEADYFPILKKDLDGGQLMNGQQICTELGKVIGENILKGRLESV